jgi:hypothetical protein
MANGISLIARTNQTDQIDKTNEKDQTDQSDIFRCLTVDE